ncbi:MAG TPA: MFS transporter [Pyrinomonadaceae bacterium]|jgi:Permeases of the major facilitator superfamily|nr:MFS transporter [Pyrinomonadaceae bacterium]
MNSAQTEASKDRSNPNLDKNDPRELFGWKMYDWANSAFYTTVVGALFSPYLTRIAQTAVGENGVVLDLGVFGAVTAKSLPSLCVSISVGAQVFLLPVLGALGDYSDLKKRLMALFCYIAVVANCLMFFIQGNLYLVGGLLFIVANVCFGASIVFYNSFLPEIATEDQADKVSSRGFAYGYLGGAILLTLNLVLVMGAERLGISTGLAVRLSLMSSGIWWGGFAVITFLNLKSRPKRKTLPPGKSYLSAGLIEIFDTIKELRRLPLTLRYLLAYLVYNDGIQTVIVAASAFLEQELFPQGNPIFLLEIFLMVQFVAVLGALMFERLAYLIKTKNAILVSLVIWVAIVIYAYRFLHTVSEAWILAAVIAIVLGGSQALSRSLFSRMIPEGKEAAFFGMYEVSERGTSWMGPLMFSIVIARTGSYRQALLSLIVFFVVGLIGLWLTDTDRAVSEARKMRPNEAMSS